MKGTKWICCVLALVVLLGGIVPLRANAIDLIDLNRTGSLMITFRVNTVGESVPLVGATFKAYRVATPDRQCELTVEESFAAFTTSEELNDLDQDGWKALSVRLGNATKNEANGIEPDYTAVTNSEGVARIENMKLGLYLVYSDPHSQDLATFEQLPALIMVPYRNQDPNLGSIDVWKYNNIPMIGKPMEAKNDVKVVKIWKDDNNAVGRRPDHLAIDLLKDGEHYDTVVLPKDGKWEYTWHDLPFGHTWTVREDESDLGDFYECAGVVEDRTGEYAIWYITNKYEPPPLPKLPQTGQLWWPVPVLLSLGLLSLLVGMLRRRGEKHEA